MRQVGKALRFWVCVLGLVVGLQSVFIAASSESFGEPGPAVEENGTKTAPPSNDVAATRESGDGPGVQASEVATERVRDHSTRSPQEMLFLFLKGTGALIAMVLIYKGLARWIASKRKSD